MTLRIKLLAMVTIIILLLQGGMAASQGVSWAAKLDLHATPDGSIGVEVAQYLALTESQQAIVSKLLTVMLENPENYTIVNGKVRFIDAGQFPDDLSGLVKILQGAKVSERKHAKVVERKDVVGVQSTPPYPGAYSWYQYVQYQYRKWNVPCSKDCHSLAVPEHNAVSNVLCCSQKCTHTASGSVSYTVPGDIFWPSVTVNWTSSISQECSISLTSTVPPGQKHTIVWTWLETREQTDYYKYYWEDQDLNGQGDFCLYMGTVYGFAKQVGGGSFDLKTAVYPCQRPCAALQCPYR
ncbi:MAG: hypothetical protein FD169_1013 [Bacillota bacterium]|nr:MAG: hypothetical protein FD169_1013 [Bacillota bacterium]